MHRIQPIPVWVSNLKNTGGSTANLKSVSCITCPKQSSHRKLMLFMSGVKAPSLHEWRSIDFSYEKLVLRRWGDEPWWPGYTQLKAPACRLCGGLWWELQTSPRSIFPSFPPSLIPGGEALSFFRLMTWQQICMTKIKNSTRVTLWSLFSKIIKGLFLSFHRNWFWKVHWKVNQKRIQFTMLLNKIIFGYASSNRFLKYNEKVI